MPQNRTARMPVFGSSAPRARSPAYLTRTSRALRRRVVVCALVLLSLALITVYFREPAGGGLHEVQGVGASALRPFEVAVERVTRPFRDVYGYFAGLVAAKSENERLKQEVVRLRQQAIQNRTALDENARLRALVELRDKPSYPKEYYDIAAAVVGHTPSEFGRRITIAAGGDDGVAKNDPVVTGDGLVGRVTKVAPGVAQVTLLIDQTSSVSAVVPRTGATGVVELGRSGSETLSLAGVEKDQVVRRGDFVVTAGRRRGELPSVYPRNLQIGVVTSVGQTDTDIYQRVQVEPFVDFSAVDAVLVLKSRLPRAGAR